MNQSSGAVRWLLGCGCLAFAGLGVFAGAGLLYYRGTRSDARGGGPSSPPAWLEGFEKERAETLEAIRRERNGQVAQGERTVKTATLRHDRDELIRCDETLSLRVRAGTFASTQPVEVKAFTVGESFLPPTVAPLAAFDVKIGPGGPLRAAIELSVRHAPLGEDAQLKAVRWDEEKAAWVALRLRRASPTETIVVTDHLSRVVVTQPMLSAYERYEFKGSGLVVWIRSDFAPPVENLYRRRGDESLFATIEDSSARSEQERKLRRTRFREEAEAGGVTDSSVRLRDRYDEKVQRRLFAEVIHAMARRIRSRDAYRERLPERYDIYVGTYKTPELVDRIRNFDPNWWQGWWVWEGVYLPTASGMGSAEELAATLGHELFHACQYQGGLGETWMRSNMWLMDATAEYAGARLAWGDGRIFDELGVKLDPEALQAVMGAGIRSSFINQPLTATRDERAYKSAHFIEYLLGRTGLGFEDLWAEMVASAATDRNEAVLARFCQRGGVRLEDAYRDFAAFLVLDKASPAASFDDAIGQNGPGARTTPAGSEAGTVSSVFPSVILDEASPSWSQRFLLSPGSIGEHLAIAVSPLLRETGKRSVTLTFTGTRQSAQIEIYQTGVSRVNLADSSPLRRLSTFTEGPVVLMVALEPTQRLHVIATRSGGGDPSLSVKAELGTLAIRATRKGVGSFRLELDGTLPDGPLDVDWEFGDGKKEQTHGAFVEHQWQKPGPHGIRATLVERSSGEMVGEATGEVVVPSALRMRILDAATGRGIGGASVRLRHSGATVSRSADGAGVAFFEEIPPQQMALSFEASASGYESQSDELTVDFSREVPVEATLRLLARRVAPPPARTSPPVAPPPVRTPERDPEPPPRSIPQPPPPRETVERTYDEQAALAAFVAAYEAKRGGVERANGYTDHYRVEWVTRPYISNGVVMGNLRTLRKKVFDDGRVVDWWVEGEASNVPFVMTTMADLQRQYPQFWRSGPGATSAPPRGSPPPSQPPPQPPPSRPAPQPPKNTERQFDVAGALAAWVADYEAKRSGAERANGYTDHYRVEWVTRPYISNGAVMGNLRTLRKKVFDDGRVVDWWVEGEASNVPFVMATVADLQKKYPQFWR